MGPRRSGHRADDCSGRTRSPRSSSPTATQHRRDLRPRHGRRHGHYERREEELGSDVMREVERQVMLRIIDQRWREHLEEMDYLQERHQPAGDGPEGPARRVAARRLRDVRRHDEGHRPGLREVRDARAGRHEQPGAGRRPTRQWCRTCRRVSSDDDDAGGFDRAARAAVVAEGELARRGVATAADRRSSRPSSRTTGRRPRATRRARAGPARSSSCATARPERRGRGAHRSCVTSPTTSATCSAALDEAGELPARSARTANGSPSSRPRLPSPDLWDDQERAKKLNAEYANVRDDLDDVRRL